MMSLAVLLLCAVSRLMLGSTSDPLQEMNTEDVVLSLSQQMSNMEERILENKNEITSKLEQVFARMSEIEESCNVAVGDVSDKLQVEKDKLVEMDDNLLSEIFELRKKALEISKNVSNVESEVSRDRARTDLLQVQLNETANMTHSCLGSQTEMGETMQKNMERLENSQSNLSARMGNVAISLEALRKDLDDEIVSVQNNTIDIEQLKQELSRIQSICKPPCENGGQCVKNVCNCSPSFIGDRCQEAICSPPCENGGQCLENNICHCTPLFTGDRCQDEQCGAVFDNGDNDGGGNISSAPVWPWMAAVHVPSLHAKYLLCEGSVIHQHFVLTSARCLFHYGNERLTVKLGLSDLKNGIDLQEYKVQSAHMHPQYKTGQGPHNYNDQDYNVGLLELEEAIPFGPFVRPICLPPREIPEDEPFYKPQSTAQALLLSSYLRSPQSASPTVLNLTILSQEESIRKLTEKRWEKHFPSPDLSFGAESSQASCPEMGSPLIETRLARDGTRTWTQVGIQSLCGSKYFFSPRLDHLRAWVETTMAAASSR